MKKMMLALVALFWMTVSASAMSYEQAREQALFLTDKMAYELNLTDDQYEAAYEVNLDYLMGVNHYDDLYGVYWRQRNMDLSYILLDWQYQAFLNASYFYRPLYWEGGYWHFGIYARYPHRDYFYFGRPHFFDVYRGGHSWRMNGGRSWYNGRQFGGAHPGGDRRIGMRDGFNRGDYGRGQSFGNMNRPNNSRGNGGMRIGDQQRMQQNTRSYGNFNNRSVGGNNRDNNRSFGNSNSRSFGNANARSYGNRESSTRTTVTRNRNMDGNESKVNSRSFGNSSQQRSSVFGGNKGNSNNSRSFTPRSTPSTGSSFNSRSFGGGNRNSGGSVGGARNNGGGGNHGGGSFGGRR